MRDAAFAVANRKNSSLVAEHETLIANGDLAGAVQFVNLHRGSLGLRAWEDTLESILDCELALDQVRGCIGLLKLQPDSVALAQAHFTPGAWVHFLTSMWSILLDGLLERSKKTVSKTVRVAIRPYDPNWKKFEEDMVGSINALNTKLGKVRNPVAHGGGPIGGITEEGLILSAILSGEWFDVPGILDSQVDRRQRWHGIFLQVTTTAVATLDVVFQKLSDAVSENSIGSAPSNRA